LEVYLAAASLQDKPFKYYPPQCLTAALVRIVCLRTGPCFFALFALAGIVFVSPDTTYLLLHSVRPVSLQEAGHWSLGGSWFD
jgi:hypothetical protein